MCGIVAYSLKNANAFSFAIKSLHHLEYRGYDSVGISYIENSKICTKKLAGRVSKLEKSFTKEPFSNVAIAHTRWSTHGKSTDENAHPHNAGRVSLVHNGIIENYSEIKKELIAKGCEFKSTTDTETIAHFINLELAHSKPSDIIQKILKVFKGKYAVCFLIEGEENIYAFRSHGSPMVIGFLKDGNMLASDFNTVAHHTNKFALLEDNHFIIMNSDIVKLYDLNGLEVKIKPIEKDIKATELTKNGFDTFMMKEINEQPNVIRNLITHYIKNDQVNNNIPDLSSFERIYLIACGTSYYASHLGKYVIEGYTNIPVSIEISSEFAHRKQPFLKKTLYVFASQSGETADTIAALDHTKASKTDCSKILSILNNAQSTMAEKSDFIIECLAGPEIGVASTKNFIAQAIVFYLIMLKNIQDSTLTKKILDEMYLAPQALENILQNVRLTKEIKNAAKQITEFQKVVITGRTLLFPIACEASLKLSELSYIPVQSISAGEFKHGPIAIVDKSTLVISLAHSNNMYAKTILSNEEILSRDGHVITISDMQESTIFIDDAKGFVYLYPILLTAIAQLLSYYTAELLGNDIDKPRNLAKSVTVE